VSTSDKSDMPNETASGGRFRIRRRRWLVVAVLILLLLAVIGWVASDTDDDPAAKDDAGASSQTAAPSTPTTTATETTAAAPAQLSLNRDGNDVTLAGNLPGDTEKSELVSAIKSQWTSANVIDKINIAPGTGAPDLSGVGGLLAEAGAIADFGMSVHGSDMTLTGTAPNLDIASQVQSTAVLVFPNLKLTNNLQIPATGAPPMDTPAPNAPQGPTVPTPTSCPALQADIAVLLHTPISFNTGGAELAGDSRRLVSQIAGKIKACPGAAVTVVGYTDNVGSESINQHLSAARAKAVADELVSDGVAVDHVSSRGAGSANPIAGNDTPAGRAQNRRVTITVN
jgi:peptidoglycan-binding protein ArfA